MVVMALVMSIKFQKDIVIARINRIYEGTNEINRLLTVDMVLKRAMKGKLDLMTPAMAVQKELMSIPDFGDTDDAPFAKELKYITNFKKAILMVAGAAVQKLMMQLEKEQEVLMNIADMAIEVFHTESALLRVMKLDSKKWGRSHELASRYHAYLFVRCCR